MIFPLMQKELSIDDYVDRDEECRFSVLIADTKSESQEEKIYNREVGAIVQRALGRLDERELLIIRNRFGLLGGQEQTLEEIGKTMNLSRERVRQLEREAKDKLRVCLGPQRGNLGSHWPNLLVPPAAAAGIPPNPPLLPAAAAPRFGLADQKSTPIPKTSSPALSSGLRSSFQPYSTRIGPIGVSRRNPKPADDRRSVGSKSLTSGRRFRHRGKPLRARRSRWERSTRC
jgi:hypothetical protein